MAVPKFDRANPHVRHSNNEPTDREMFRSALCRSEKFIAFGLVDLPNRERW